jgi:hypothetical protein
MFNFCWHCWHHVDGTRRKLKSNSSCKESDPYIADNLYVKYIMKKRCCKCGKIKNTEIYRDYQIDRGLSYPPYYLNI